jgi:uncharacterized protein (UPF0332 family)
MTDRKIQHDKLHHIKKHSMTIDIDVFKLRTRENIQAAEALWNLGFFNASANRAYYAAFHAAMVFLLNNGIPVEPDHRKVQNAFNGEAIARRKLLPSRWKEFLGEMQDVRNNADYKNKGVSKNRSNEQLSRAKEFISTLLPEIQP